MTEGSQGGGGSMVVRVFEYGMDKRKHYWNGRWGRLARHDVLLYEDGGQWVVEDRKGGAEGRSQWAEFDQEEGAFNHVRDLLAGGDEWREL